MWNLYFEEPFFSFCVCDACLCRLSVCLPLTSKSSHMSRFRDIWASSETVKIRRSFAACSEIIFNTDICLPALTWVRWISAVVGALLCGSVMDSKWKKKKKSLLPQRNWELWAFLQNTVCKKITSKHCGHNHYRNWKWVFKVKFGHDESSKLPSPSVSLFVLKPMLLRKLTKKVELSTFYQMS